jgi:hypothetical protein
MLPIEAVQYVAAYEPRRPDIFTYIECMDESIMERVFEAEDAIDAEYPDLLIDFHVVFLDGRTMEDFVRPVPALFFDRAKESGAHGVSN